LKYKECETSNVGLDAFRMTVARLQNISKAGQLEGRNTKHVDVLYTEHNSCTSVGKKKEKGKFAQQNNFIKY